MLFPLNELISGRTLTTIMETQKVSDALHLMIAHDFSYLPVVDGQGKLTGITSEQVIVRKYYHFGGDKLLYDLAVSHCQMRAMILPPTADIFDALTPLQNVGAVVVVDGGLPVGIITDYDTTQFFRAYSEGIILAQDIEFNLRRHIEDVFPLNNPQLDGALIAALGLTKDQRRAGRPSREYDELSLWDHVQLILTDSNWSNFEVALKPKAMFQKLLEPVREARNQMAHFRGELTAVQLDALKQARYWLENRKVVSALQMNAPVVVDVTSINGAPNITAILDTVTASAVVEIGSATDSADIGGTRLPTNSTSDDRTTSSNEATTRSRNDMSQDTNAVRPDVCGLEELHPNNDAGGDRDTETPAQRLGRKYTPLERWLLEQAKEQTHIRISFKLIEEIIGESLPPSARQHSNWWANDSTSRSQSIAWLSAGWRVESVDLDGETVTLRRTDSTIRDSFLRNVIKGFRKVRPNAMTNNRLIFDGWFTSGSGGDKFIYRWMFNRGRVRIELLINADNQKANIRYFNILSAQRDLINDAIGQQVIWQQKNTDNLPAIGVESPVRITETPEAITEYEEWAIQLMVKFVDTFEPLLSQPELPRTTETE